MIQPINAILVARDKTKQRLLSQTNLCVAPGSTPYSKLQFPHVENGDNHRLSLMGLPRELLQQCMGNTYLCWGKVPEEVSTPWITAVIDTCWSSLSMKLCIPQLSRTRIFYFFCVHVFPAPAKKGCPLLDSCIGKASQWLLSPDNTVPWMPLESLPADPQLLQGELHTSLQDSKDFTPRVLLTTSSAMLLKERKWYQRDFLLACFSTKIIWLC